MILKSQKKVVDLTKRLKDGGKTSDGKYITGRLDIENLFTYVPLDEVIDILCVRVLGQLPPKKIAPQP